MLSQIHSALRRGLAVPYLGPAVLILADPAKRPPLDAAQLVARLAAGSNIPHKLRQNLTAAAQYIENFKHRKSLVQLVNAAFDIDCPVTALHELVAGVPNLPLIVHAWYDDLCRQALSRRTSWGTIQGLSQAEHGGEWTRAYQADGTPAGEISAAGNGVTARSVASSGDAAHQWECLLYEPLGAVRPAANFLVSDSDFVEVMTEIDIQTPIPEEVQNRRRGRSFLFLGCRFNTQIDRILAFEIAKRSADHHWAILPEEPTSNEIRFMRQYNIERIAMPLDEFVRTTHAALAQTTKAA